MSETVIYFSRFLPTCDRGGGSRRMLQMLEVFQELNCQLVTSARGDWLRSEDIQRITIEMQQIERDPRNENNDLLWNAQRRPMVYRLREIAKLWGHTLSENSALRLAIMDDPIYFRPLFERLQALHVPVIAVCHNLETLAPDQVQPSTSLTLLQQEIDLLSRCQGVITISREEQWLLTNLRIPALFFPYYPVEPIRARLLQVRNARKNTSKENILLIGTALNVQTRNGILQITRYWEEHRLDHIAGKLLVAGYDTEKYFASEQFGEAVTLLGPLANDVLDTLFSQVKACLCFQESGTGALTRICEMLLANVPVLANSHAARSYYQRNGVIEFGRLAELENILTKLDADACEISMPEKPEVSKLNLYLNSKY